MTLRVPVIQEQLFRVPAHRFQQGRRIVYTFALSLAELNGILPQRVDETVVREANRRLTPSHAKQIEMYLRDYQDWVLGSLMVSIDPDAVTFVPFQDSDGNPSPTYGELQIPYNRMGGLRLFDGQHRRRAIQDLLSSLRDVEQERIRFHSDAQRNGNEPELLAMLQDQIVAATSQREELERQSVPIVLYLEGDITALRRMFSDAAKTKPIDAVTRARFDDRDPFNRAAVEVAELSELLRGRIEMERNTVARTSPNLLAFNQLSTTLKTLAVGYYGRVSRIRNMEFDANIEPIVQTGIDWADDFLPAACMEYEQLLNRESDDVSLIPALRRETFALNATVLRVLAACYHGWKLEVGEDVQALACYLRKESFNQRPTSLLIRAGLVAVDATSPVARRQEVQRTIRYILRHAKQSPAIRGR